MADTADYVFYRTLAPFCTTPRYLSRRVLRLSGRIDCLLPERAWAKREPLTVRPAYVFHHARFRGGGFGDGSELAKAPREFRRRSFGSQQVFTSLKSLSSTSDCAASSRIGKSTIKYPDSLVPFPASYKGTWQKYVRSAKAGAWRDWRQQLKFGEQ
ncbi:hypothetical protein DIPPA_18345 [Diplonema papillatum]|nr:hypothetical protein DIPPA_18345 [Diplonema papillatum]